MEQLAFARRLRTQDKPLKSAVFFAVAYVYGEHRAERLHIYMSRPVI